MHAFKRIVRSKVHWFTVLLLGLAVGTSTTLAMFASAAFLQPLPYDSDEQLVIVENPRGAALSLEQVRDWSTAGALRDFAAYRLQPGMVLAGEVPERLQLAVVTERLFEVLGVRPLLGESFRATDGHQVIVLSHACWVSCFNRAPDIVGRPVSLSGTQYLVKGVMPEAVDFPHLLYPKWERFDGWIPLREDAERGVDRLRVVGRLRSDVTLSEVSGQLAAVQKGTEERIPMVVSLRDAAFGTLKLPLTILGLTFGFTWCLAGLSAGALQFAARERRLRDVAVQSALGASRARLVLQAWSEAVVVGIAIVIAASVCFWLSLRVTAVVWPPDLSTVPPVQVDFKASLILLTLCCLSVFLCYLPSLVVVTTRTPSLLVLRGGGTSQVQYTSVSSTRVRAALVAAQISLAVGLLGLAITLGSAFFSHLRGERGFDSDRVIVARVSVPLDAMRRGASALAFEELLEAASEAPGVRSAALSSGLPVIRSDSSRFGRARDRKTEPLWPARLQAVSDDYFGTLGIGVMAGRTFHSGDDRGTQPVAILDTEAARLLGPNALGSQISLPTEAAPFTVIGIVRPVRHLGRAEPDRPHLYLSHRQMPLPSAMLLVKQTVGADVAAGAVKRVLADLFPTSTPGSIATLESLIQREIAPERFGFTLLSICGLLALLVSASSVTALIAFQVANGRFELAIRSCLGASPAQAMESIVRPSVGAVSAGILLGLFGFYWGSALLHGIFPNAVAVTFWPVLVAAAVVCVSSVLGMAIPLRRAAVAEPAILLRS